MLNRLNGFVCGGPEKALRCNCGTCECTPEWSGENCDCSTSKSSCTAPNTDQLCSEHGSCRCGKCECDATYYGKFCEISSRNDSINSLCIFYEPCIACIINRKLQNGQCTDYDSKCRKYQAEFYDDISDSNIKCITRIKHKDSTCEYKFSYAIDQSETHLRIEDVVCPPVNVAQYSVIAIVIATFLIGLIFLGIYKIKITMADKREYARFEEERDKMTEYRYESPIYKSPVSKFENPMNKNQNIFEMK